MLSKPKYPIGDENTFIETKPLSYHEYYKKHVALKQYKLPELKEIAKYHHLKCCGNKSVLIDRIETLFLRCQQSNKIQKVFRGNISRKTIELRGDGFKNLALCVNDTDFYTLEPLKEMSSMMFFSFTNGKMIYGCSIVSFITLIKTKTTLKNPYNRDTISLDVIKNSIRLYQYLTMLNELPVDAPKINAATLLDIHSNIHDNHMMRDMMTRPVGQYLIVHPAILEDRREKLRIMRDKPVIVRIQELFMEIDQLGNYTHFQWFATLERQQYVRLYRMLYEIWTFRGNLTRETKRFICILDDPFIEINRLQIYMHTSSIEVARESCLKVIESMVYCGVDDEYKKIGALHALSALTVVSLGARLALPWLYESLYE
jgi:hypothetical protein